MHIKAMHFFSSFILFSMYKSKEFYKNQCLHLYKVQFNFFCLLIISNCTTDLMRQNNA